MKKFIVVLLVVVLTLSFLTACGGNIPLLPGMDGLGSGNFDFENPQDYIKENLKGDYAITFKMDSDGTVTYMKNIHTSQGYYFSSYNWEELFIKNGDQYDAYSGSLAEGFNYAGYQASEQEVENSASAFMMYASVYSQFSSMLKKDGSVTIAGRSCEKYSYEISLMGASVKYEYCIDKETGICLKFAFEGSAEGESSSANFECIEFKTSGISLPSYNKAANNPIENTPTVATQAANTQSDNNTELLAPTPPAEDDPGEYPQTAGTTQNSTTQNSGTQISGNWPDNEFTSLVPKPEFTVSLSNTSQYSFTAIFSDTTIEQIKAYVEKVKIAGFNVNADTQDQNLMGVSYYSYQADNIAGYIFVISYSSGYANMTIEKT